jgi:hypothetical protein
MTIEPSESAEAIRRPYQFTVDFTRLSERELRHPTPLQIREVIRKLRYNGLDKMDKPELRVLVNSLTLKKDSRQKMKFGIELLNTALDEYNPRQFVQLIYPKLNTLDDTGELFKYDFRNKDRKVLEKTWRKRTIKKWAMRALGWGPLGLAGIASVGAKQGTHVIDSVQGVVHVQEEPSTKEEVQPPATLNELRAILQFISDGIDIKLDPLFVLWASALLIHEDHKNTREKEQSDIVEAANAISEIGERMKGKNEPIDSEKEKIMAEKYIALEKKVSNLSGKLEQALAALEEMRTLVTGKSAVLPDEGKSV